MPRTVLITGCSDGGLGSALAIAFHKHGDRVIATARNPAKMASLKTMGIETLQLDVVSEDSLHAAVQATSELTGNSLDILINHAGAGYSTPIIEASISEISKLIDLNALSYLRTSQLFFPLLRNAQQGALIVNNTSVASISAVPLQGPYSASKAAAASISEVMRIELQPFNIRVIDLKTATVQTNFFANSTAAAGNARLSDDSLYLAGRKQIEAFMRTDIDGLSKMPADQWARQVVNDLSKSNPPAQIWRGANASSVWIASLLPVGWLDGMLKKMSGLDLVERKMKEDSKTK